MDQKKTENPETAKLRQVILQYKEGNLRIDNAWKLLKRGLGWTGDLRMRT